MWHQIKNKMSALFFVGVQNTLQAQKEYRILYMRLFQAHFIYNLLKGRGNFFPVE